MSGDVQEAQAATSPITDRIWNRQQSEIKHQRDRAERALAMLRKVEWDYCRAPAAYCTHCGAPRARGHDSDCFFLAAYDESKEGA